MEKLFHVVFENEFRNVMIYDNKLNVCCERFTLLES